MRHDVLMGAGRGGNPPPVQRYRLVREPSLSPPDVPSVTIAGAGIDPARHDAVASGNVAAVRGRQTFPTLC